MGESLQTLQDWLSWQESLHNKTMDFDPQRLKSVYQRLHLPMLAKKTIIVAGSNGKGSCVAMLQSIYTQAGYRVGAYTSPHLLYYNERISINQQSVSDERIIAAFNTIEKCRQDTPLTYYEYGTLAAFVCFAESNLDVAILEVGLGGRLDATNIIDCDASILTSFTLDHQEWLGNTLEEIAYEKAGVMREHQLAFCGEYEPPHTLLDHADSCGANLKLIGRDFDIEIDDVSWAITSGIDEHYGPIAVPKLNGEHQYRNAACVIQLCRAFKDDFPLGLDSINKGLASTQLAGRCEVISLNPQIIIDVSHNEGAVIELDRYLQSLPKPEKCYILLSILDDKPAEAFFERLEKHADRWYFSQAQAPRALAASQLKSRYNRYHKGKNTEPLPNSYHRSIEKALKMIAKEAGKNDRVLIIGSFYTVSEALHHAK